MDTTTQIQDIAVTDDVAAKQPPFDFEKAIALLATGLVGLLLVLTASNAGPLWRDETNSINLVQMPSLNEFWKNLKFDSFPLTWLLVLRAWDVIGFAQTDFGIRLLGLMVGFGSLGALWLCARWFGTRGPIISLALLGTLPNFINIVGANRAYGLGVCLLLLSFASIWRVVQSPSKPRLLLAILITLLFVHCVFYDLIFLAAMLFAGAVVVLRRKQWKALLALIAIGAIACASLVIYVPMIRQQSHPELVRVPFNFWTLWTKFSLAVESRSSARIPISIGSESWVWVILALLGVGSAMLIQRHWRGQGDDLGKMEQGNCDLPLFGAITLMCGALGFTWFLLRIQLPTQSWYYAIVLSFFTVCFEATLATHFKAFRPWGLMRVCFLIVAALWGGKAVFEEAHTRRSNVDLVAQRLRSECKDGDLILVQTPWEAITFDRYFQHTTEWMSVPPIASHKLHRVDLLIEKLNDPKLLDPVMEAVDKALDGGHDVWVVGHVEMSRTPILRKSAEPWLGAYFTSWGSEVMAHILGKSELIEWSSSPKGLPLNYLENLPLRRFRAQEAKARSQS